MLTDQNGAQHLKNCSENAGGSEVQYPRPHRRAERVGHIVGSDAESQNESDDETSDHDGQHFGGERLQHPD